MLEELGTQKVKEPHVKPLGNKLWEIRMKGVSGIARAIYVTVQDKKMSNLRTLKEKWLKNSDVKQHYDALEEEFNIAIMLIKARDEAGFTQDQVAEKMHTKQSVVSRMESGRIIPSLSSILRYAKAIGFHAKILLEKTS